MYRQQIPDLAKAGPGGRWAAGPAVAEKHFSHLPKILPQTLRKPFTSAKLGLDINFPPLYKAVFPPYSYFSLQGSSSLWPQRPFRAAPSLPPPLPSYSWPCWQGMGGLPPSSLLLSCSWPCWQGLGGATLPPPALPTGQGGSGRVMRGFYFCPHKKGGRARWPASSGPVGATAPED
jgi:hypothetical protein